MHPFLMFQRLPDGVRLRGDIHVLLLGDPSTAKSQVGAMKLIYCFTLNKLLEFLNDEIIVSKII